MDKSKSPLIHWRWMILIAKSCTSFITLGMFKSLGVFIPYFVDDFQTSVASVGLVCVFYRNIAALLAPVISALALYVQPRKLVMAGSVVMSLGTIGATTSTSVFHLGLWFTLSSIGQAAVIVPSFKPLMDYFPDRFAMANGIAFSFGSIGMMLLPPVAEWLIQIYGWRGALFILGGVNFNVCVFGALYRPLAESLSEATYQQLPEKHEADAPMNKRDLDDTSGSQGIVKNCKAFLRNVKDRFDTSLFVDEPLFLIYLVAFFITGVVFSGWHLFLVPHAIALGYDSQLSSFLSTFGGIGSVLSRIANGFITDYNIISSVNLFILASVLCAVSSFIDPLVVSSFVALSILSSLTGISTGFSFTLPFVIVRDITHKEQHMAAIGWLYLFLGVGNIVGGYLSGWLYDVTNDYEIVFVVYGCLSLVVVPLMFAPKLAELCCPAA